MFNFDTAKQAVKKHLSEYYSIPLDELLILDDMVECHDFGWVFFYQSKKYIETHIRGFQLAGNAPIIFNRTSGEIVVTGTSYPIEYYVNNYKQFGIPVVMTSSKLTVFGCERRADSVGAIKAVRKYCGLNLLEAKKIVEQCLSGNKIVLHAKDLQSAISLLNELQSCGFQVKQLNE